MYSVFESVVQIPTELKAIVRIGYQHFVFPCLLLVAGVSIADESRYLDQAWDEHDRDLFYYTHQGSEIILFDWFMALQQPDSDEPFSDAEYLKTFGWLYHNDKDQTLNKDQLPVGFTRGNGSEQQQWLGINCAACHTSELHLGGTKFRVDGGAAMIELDGFVAALSSALSRTYHDEKRFQLFVEEVQARQPDTDADTLKQEFSEFYSRFVSESTMRQPALPTGPGRMDALGQIINSLAVYFTKDSQNYRIASAPVSIPHLWLAPHLSRVQWNASARQALPRNIGQVMGVFGRANFVGPEEQLFESSVNLPNLILMENWLKELEPPRWNEEFGDVDMSQAEEGRGIFKDYCVGCHSTSVDQRPITVQTTPYDKIGTDPLYTTNLIDRQVRTGALASLMGSAESVPAPVFLVKTVAAITAKSLGAVDGQTTAQAESQASPLPNVIKSGPLHGIWASGPYLHNGSVRTIYDLLSDPAKRPETFRMGSLQFDAEKLGYVSEGGFLFDTRLPGNSNQGHKFPKEREFDEAEKMALIEYLKVAGRFSD